MTEEKMTENEVQCYSKDVKFIILLFVGMLFLSVAVSVAVAAKSNEEAIAIMENAGHRPTKAEVEEWVETHKNPIVTLSCRENNYFFYDAEGQVIYRPDIQRRLDEIAKKAKRPQKILRIFNL